MTNHELGQKLGTLIREERKITNEILTLINIALDKRAYVDLGFSSMFDWLVRGFGYSKASAFRRIEAARILKAVPQAFEKLKEGKVNLSSLSKAQSMIRQHEKISGEVVTQEVKEQIVEKIENKSIDETEKFLFSLFPGTASPVFQERHYVLSETQTRYQMTLSTEATDDLKRLKEILSHKFPQGTDAEIVSHALKELVKRIDPLQKQQRQLARSAEKRKLSEELNSIQKTESLRKPDLSQESKSSQDADLSQKPNHFDSPDLPQKTKPHENLEQSEKPELRHDPGAFQKSKSIQNSASSQGANTFQNLDSSKMSNRLQNRGCSQSSHQRNNYGSGAELGLSKRAMRDKVLVEANGQCTFKDHVTGRACESRYQVENDHCIPVALGGADHFSNFRALCRQHNLLMAERLLGKKLMDRYRR